MIFSQICKGVSVYKLGVYKQMGRILCSGKGTGKGTGQGTGQSSGKGIGWG